MKYTVGVKLSYRYDDDNSVILGQIIENFKFPGDICVRWDTGQVASYDEEWLNERTEVVMGD